MASKKSLVKAKAADLTAQSTEELRAELARGLELTADHLSYLARIWQELERRGEDLSALRVGLSAYLPLIAAGQADAQAVVRFSGSATVLKAITGLPIAEQRRLARGGKVPIVTVTESGELTETECDPLSLPITRVNLLFKHGRLRSVAEQRMLLQGRLLMGRAPRRDRVVFDRRRRVLRVGQRDIPLDEILRAIAQEGPPVFSDAEPRKPLNVDVPESVHAAVKEWAARAGFSLKDLIVMALWMAGVLQGGEGSDARTADGAP